MGNPLCPTYNISTNRHRNSAELPYTLTMYLRHSTSIVGRLASRRAFSTRRLQYGELDTGSTTLAFASHQLGAMLMPGAYARPETGQPSGVEVAFLTSDVQAAFLRAVAAGATPLAEPKVMPGVPLWPIFVLSRARSSGYRLRSHDKITAPLLTKSASKPTGVSYFGCGATRGSMV